MTVENRAASMLQKEKAMSSLESLVRVQRKYSAIKGMRTCNLRPIPEAEDLSSESVELELRVNQRGVRFTGLQTCKNANCQYCMESVRSAHVRKIQYGIEEGSKRGWSTYFSTFTSIATNDAELALYRCGKGWEKIRQCLRNSLGKEGIRYHYTRAYDVTFNKTRRAGVYHVHIHALIMVDSFVCNDFDDGSAWIHDIVSSAWRKQNKHAIAAAQYTERVQSAGMARYMAKWYGIAHEIANSVKKEGRSAGSMTLIGLMQSADSDEESASIYADYTAATRRKRMIQFSGRARGYGNTWRDMEDESLIGPAEWYPWIDPPKEEDEETEEDPLEETISIPEHWWRTLRPVQDRVSYTIWNGVYIEQNRALSDFKSMLAIQKLSLIYDEKWRENRLKGWLNTYRPWRSRLSNDEKKPKGLINPILQPPKKE
jgi:hypothetical protein